MVREFLSKIIDKILNFFTSFKTKYLEKKPEEVFDFEDLYLLFEDYIGLIIIDFQRFDKNIPDLMPDIVGKYISEVQIGERDIFLNLVDLYGNTNGMVVVSPAITGQFGERDEDGNPPEWSTKYKITFFGGACIEYMDVSDTGRICYLENSLSRLGE